MPKQYVANFLQTKRRQLSANAKHTEHASTKKVTNKTNCTRQVNALQRAVFGQQQPDSFGAVVLDVAICIRSVV